MQTSATVLAFPVTMSNRVLGLVPARGGSKGIPRKNARKLGPKFLLQYTAEAALKSRCVSRVVLSTDDSEIAEIGKRCGLDVPFLRPAEIARDETPMLDVVRHAVEWLAARNDSYDAVCLLQPTSPLRSAATIDRCLEALWTSSADSVVSVSEVPTEYNPHWVYFKDAHGYLRISTGEIDPVPSRQQLPKAYHRNGSIFVVKTSILLSQNSLYGTRVVGVLTPVNESADLDTVEQWEALDRSLSE